MRFEAPQHRAPASARAINVLVTNGELVPTVAKLLCFDLFRVRGCVQAPHPPNGASQE